MTFPRSRRFAALAGLAAMLFAQAALALAACELDTKPSRGTALATAFEQAAQPPCHESAPAADPLCLMHCQSSDPSLDKTQAPIVVLPVAALPSAPVRVTASRTVQPLPEAPPVAPPPARILFRSLQI